MNKHSIFLIFSVLLIGVGCQNKKKSITPLENIYIGIQMEAAIKEIKNYRKSNLISNTHRVSINDIKCRIDFHYCQSKVFKNHTLEGISLVPNDSTLINKLLSTIKTEGLSNNILVEKVQVNNVRDLFIDFEAIVIIHSDLLFIDNESIIQCKK